MAADTNRALQKQVIYSIYVRSHTDEGSFRAIIPDLDRIRALGTDIIWLMPIHPIGETGRKGSRGCPYANRDYRAVNPEYGTMEDFKSLVDEIHARGMKCMIDVVYNHTSPDSTLYEQHPEFFYHNAQGRPANKIGDWADVIDLDYSVRALWDYQIESLKMWAGIVDGFRCDVASFVPLEFWIEARRAVKAVRPECVWLAETVHQSYGCRARRLGIYSMLDYEGYEAFDIEYDYDIREVFDKYMRGEAALSHWLDLLNYQEGAYPANYNKLRCLENHDQPRIASLVRDERALINFTALLYFLKGTTLIYAGQEYGNTHLPSLFEKETIDCAAGRELSALMRRLYEIKKDALGAGDWFRAEADDENDVAICQRGSGAEAEYIGVFSLRGREAEVAPGLADGVYDELISGGRVRVAGGRVHCHGTPMIISAQA